MCYIYMYVYIYVCMYVNIFECMYKYTNVFMRTILYIYTMKSVLIEGGVITACMYIYMHVFMYVYLWKYE